jgi:hypothetical protein
MYLFGDKTEINPRIYQSTNILLSLKTSLASLNEFKNIFHLIIILF